MAKSKGILKWVLIGIISFVLVVVIGLTVFICVSLNSLESTMDEQNQKIKAALVKKADAMVELVDIVEEPSKNMGDFSQYFNKVREAQKTVSKANTIKELSAAYLTLDTAYNELMSVEAEAFGFCEMDEAKDDIESAQNMLVIEVDAHNVAAKEYNEAIAQFPGSLISGVFGFDGRTEFSGIEK